MTAVMICLGRCQNGIEKDTIGLLSILLSSELNAQQKKEYLENDFGIPMTMQLEQEVKQMCNYSDGVEQKGIEKSSFLTLCDLVKDNLLKPEDAAKQMDLTKEVFQEKMREAGYWSQQKN